MYDRRSEIDLKRHLALGVEFIINNLDERNNYLPFFHYELIQEPTCIRHGPFDSPHVVGRFLDALGCCSRIIELPDETEIYDALAQQLYASLERHQSGLPWNSPAPWQPDVAAMHNCREVALGLLALWNWRADARAEPALRCLCRSILATIGDGARFPGESLGAGGWTNAFNGILAPPPATTGRLIRPLVQYYRRSADEAALELARRFAADNLETAFDADGSIAEAAGTHMHSITGTITGLIDYGILAGDETIIEGARRAYDVGMRPFRSSYGWVKEFRWAPWLKEPLGAAGYAGFDINRGEANNTGDLIEAALLLGEAGYAGYYDDADRMLRNHLLASQMVDTSWVREAAGYEDDDEASYGNVARRARGGFCFGGTKSLISYPEEAYQVNADLVGGALQSICEAWEAIASVGDKNVRIDLLYSKEDSAYSLTCPPPGPEPIALRFHEAASLQLRIPSWANPAGVTLQINDMAQSSAGDLIMDGYLRLSTLAPETLMKIWLPSRRETVTEFVGGERCEIDWHNDTVLGISPPARFQPLYGRD
ncbi:MAG: glycoside hydrolase family 127 protein [Chloroflexota bacterium]|nr:glycoside hydrolase family 127 protein [Chloroflexota bacterium]